MAEFTCPCCNHVISMTVNGLEFHCFVGDTPDQHWDIACPGCGAELSVQVLSKPRLLLRPKNENETRGQLQLPLGTE